MTEKTQTAAGDTGTAHPGSFSRGQLLRDALVFQGKLIVDGLRDLALLPISIIATAVALVQGKGRPGLQFYEVVAFGRQTERWINLFGAADRIEKDAEPPPTENIDTLVDRVEGLIRDEYRKGTLTESARNAIDRVLKTVSRDTDGGEGKDEKP